MNNSMMMNWYGWTQLADERGFIAVFPNGSVDPYGNRFWDVDYDFHQHQDYGDPYERPFGHAAHGHQNDWDQMYHDEWGMDHLGNTRALLTVDWDGDGWLDLARRSLDGPASLALSTCGSGHWLTIHLDQPAPNVDAIGAVVEVLGPGRTWTEWVQAGGHSLFASREP